MAKANPSREDREHKEPKTPKAEDERSHFQRDVDRIIYSSAFMRLAGVTQVAHSADSCVVHNRLTHSLKVASIGRGLAQRLLDSQRKLARELGGVDIHVVEASGLAHDLGHPPFGHVAEEVLNKCVHEIADIDAFEGNAQSFRVVTKLAVRKRHHPGINLTRATLNALLKYPWLRSSGHPKKWNAYQTEEQTFKWARALAQPGSEERGAEAEIMNWADDMAYSTHDVDDYYRAGLIPLDRLLTSKTELNGFLAGSFQRIGDKAKPKDLANAFSQVLKLASIFRQDLTKPFNGTRSQRAAIHSLASRLLKQLFVGIELHKPTATNKRSVAIDKQIEDQMLMLKQLVWHYVIHNPALANRERGQRQIIEELFRVFFTEAKEGHLEMFSYRHQEQIHDIEREFANDAEARQRQIVRVVVDVIAEMTEHQAIQTFRQVTGHSASSVLDFVHR